MPVETPLPPDRRDIGRAASQGGLSGRQDRGVDLGKNMGLRNLAGTAGQGEGSPVAASLTPMALVRRALETPTLALP